VVSHRCLGIFASQIAATDIRFVAWVAIINTMNAEGLPDLILTLVTLGIFALGSLGGLFKLCRLPGLVALSILGGMSVGMRVVLMREGLLLSPIGLNWIIIAVCTAAGSATTLFKQRIGIVRVTILYATCRQNLTRRNTHRPFLARSPERSSFHSVLTSPSTNKIA
jgi:hypothetical protein